ncbi:MAG: type II secretion system protein [Planctomycetota bacterium]
MRKSLLQENRPGYRAAFSIIEILVVISIITALIGISIPVAFKLLAGADVSKTRTMLQGLAAAADEYALITGGLPDHRVNNVVVPAGAGTFTNATVTSSPDDNLDNTIGVFLSRAMKNETVENFIRSAVGSGDNSLLVSDGNGGTSFDPSAYRINDPWGNRIRYARFVSYQDNDPRIDDDKRLTFDFTNDDYLPRHPNAFFASPGPDMMWGTFDADGLPDAEAEDNLYSFELD